MSLILGVIFWRSAAVERAGGTAVRIGLHNGYDLSTKAGYHKAAHLVRTLKPKYLHCSPPCFPFSIMQNANQRTQEQVKRLEEKKGLVRKILKHCCSLLEIQLDEMGGDGGLDHDGGLEQPLRATSWQEPCLPMVTRRCGGRFRVEGCRHGMRDPKTQMTVLKSFGWISTSPEVRTSLARQCNHGHGSHIPIEGERTASTAVYPPLLCERFAKAILPLKTLFNNCGTIVGMLNPSITKRMTVRLNVVHRNQTACQIRVCPCNKEVYASKQGVSWHVTGCHKLTQISPKNLLPLRGCSFCACPWFDVPPVKTCLSATPLCARRSALGVD